MTTKKEVVKTTNETVKLAADIKGFARKFEWITVLGENIESLAGIENALRLNTESLAKVKTEVEEAESLLEGIRTDSDGVIADALATKATATQVLADATIQADIRVTMSSGKADTIITEAHHNAKNIIAAAELDSSNARKEAAQAAKDAKKSQAKLNAINKEYDKVVADIEAAKEKAKAMFAGLS